VYPKRTEEGEREKRGRGRRGEGVSGPGGVIFSLVYL
jgi:hypothetical protein